LQENGDHGNTHRNIRLSCTLNINNSKVNQYISFFFPNLVNFCLQALPGWSGLTVTMTKHPSCFKLTGELANLNDKVQGGSSSLQSIRNFRAAFDSLISARTVPEHVGIPSFICTHIHTPPRMNVRIHTQIHCICTYRCAPCSWKCNMDMAVQRGHCMVMQPGHGQSLVFR
jgi:hypothetical protein